MIPFWPVPSSLNHRQYLLRLKAGSAFLVVQYFAYKLCFELAHQGHSWKFFFNNSKMHSLSSIEMLTKAKLHFLQKSIKMQFHHGQKEWGKKKVRDRGRRLVMNGFKITSTKFFYYETVYIPEMIDELFWIRLRKNKAFTLAIWTYLKKRDLELQPHAAGVTDQSEVWVSMWESEIYSHFFIFIKSLYRKYTSIKNYVHPQFQQTNICSMLHYVFWRLVIHL